MPGKQKRFGSESSILKEIEKMEAQIARQLKNGAALEDSFKHHVGAELDYKRMMAGKARRSASLAAGKKEELGKALARFRTMLLPMPMNDDSSVVL